MDVFTGYRPKDLHRVTVRETRRVPSIGRPFRPRRPINSPRGHSVPPSHGGSANRNLSDS